MLVSLGKLVQNQGLNLGGGGDIHKTTELVAQNIYWMGFFSKDQNQNEKRLKREKLKNSFYHLNCFIWTKHKAKIYLFCFTGDTQLWKIFVRLKLNISFLDKWQRRRVEEKSKTIALILYWVYWPNTEINDLGPCPWYQCKIQVPEIVIEAYLSDHFSDHWPLFPLLR